MKYLSATFKTALFITVLLVFLNEKAIAWGNKGHKIVAQIAWNELTPAARENLSKFMGKNEFIASATWLDDIRNDQAFNYTKDWHYAEHTRNTLKTVKGKIVEQLNNSINELKHYTSLRPDEVSFYLKVLIHLTGDIHQPLHCGFKEDAGGNAVNVAVGNYHTNLHKIWDDEIIYKNKIVATDCMAYIPRIKEAAAPKIWLSDTQQLLSVVYDYRGNEITNEYIYNNSIYVKKQLAIAGKRLAEVLNNIFS